MQEPTLGPSTSSPPDRVGGVTWERATIEKLVFAQIKEQQAARRWKLFMRLAWLAIFGAVIWFVYKADSMSVPITTPLRVSSAIVSIASAPSSGMTQRASP